MNPENDTLPLREALRAAMARTEDSGRLPHSEVARLRRLAEAMRESAACPGTPAELFGAWSSLPAPIQTHLRRAVERDVAGEFRALLQVPVMDLPLRLLLTVMKRLWNSGRKRSHTLLEHLFQITSTRPARLRASASMLWAAARWRLSARPPVVSLLGYLGRAPVWLAGDYVTDVFVAARHRGYLYDRGRNVVSGYVIGLDLVPATDGVWCVESNLNAGLPGGIDSFSGEIVSESMTLAEEMGARRVYWVGGSRAPVNSKILKSLAEAAERPGMETFVLEDPRLPTQSDLPEGVPRPLRGLGPPWPIPEDSLVLRVRGYGSGADGIVAGKDHFLRCLASGLELTGDSGVRVPLMTAEPRFAAPVGPGFPNLVYKYPDEDRGRGVFFLRARDRAHAVKLAHEVDRRKGWHGGLFQPFVPSLLRPGRRVQHLRTMLLLTPVGVRYLSVVRLESSRAVPERLPDGVVPDTGHFACNLALGGVRTLPEREEIGDVIRATLAVGEALRALLERGFVVESSL